MAAKETRENCEREEMDMNGGVDAQEQESIGPQAAWSGDAGQRTGLDKRKEYVGCTDDTRLWTAISKAFPIFSLQH